MVFPRFLKGLPGEVIVMHPPVLLQIQASFRDQHVDMGVEVDFGSEGMEHHDDPRNEPTLSAPLQDRLPGRIEQDIEELPIPQEHVPQLVGDGEDDMAIGDVKKLRHCLFHPGVRHHLAARRAEACFARVGDDPFDLRVVRAAVEVVSLLERIPAGEHLLHCFNDARTYLVPVLRKEERPMILEDLFDGILAAYRLYH